MTHCVLHIGLPHCGAEALQQVLNARREALQKTGILVPRSLGRLNHTRLYMSATDPDHIDPLRWQRGHAEPTAQADLRQDVCARLYDEVEKARPDRLIVTDWHLSTLSRKSELARVKSILEPCASSFEVVIYLDEQARLLVREYAEQISEGRLGGMDTELGLAVASDWRAAALAFVPAPQPETNQMAEVQAPPFWLDFVPLVAAWADVFGADALRLRPFLPERFAEAAIGHEASACFGLPDIDEPFPVNRPPPQPSAVSLARARQMNGLFDRLVAKGRHLPRNFRRKLLRELETEGAPIAPGALHPISARFAPGNESLSSDWPALAAALTPDPKEPAFAEAGPGEGYRATQFLAAFMPAIDAATNDHEKRLQDSTGTQPSDGPMTPLPKAAHEQYEKLKGGRLAPHNKLGPRNGPEDPTQFSHVPARKLPGGTSGNVIVACMKNEGPYIVEWVAYHRAIGVDNFLIYTNGCEDGTDEILGRLQEMGVVQHRLNDDWRGKSPQQYALNRSLREKLVKQAEWVIHIDVDEFINIRTGNGRLEDLFAAVPEATNIAMTWRLFGHNGVTGFADAPIIEQFDHCAPSYCPKPHTAWGFKTITRNIGAYNKISCHRPTKLNEDMRERVLWVNGAGRAMRQSYAEKGWRSDVKTIGYDLVQLNHYALRSAESFLIKRQRGRALHVDRSIGLNYWIRMDWSYYPERTIQRNLDRLQTEMKGLLADKKLAKAHADAVAWHKAKAKELRDTPEFGDLMNEALEIRLDPLGRVAYSLALDMES